jgi:electron transfer flavoprotein beta subunit
MKILVAIKKVPDFKNSIRLKSDTNDIDVAHVKAIINPFDEIAIEEAVCLKEKGKADEVIIVTIGDELSQEILRTGLAMGADRAVLVSTETVPQPLGVAKILQALILKEQPQLVFLGKQAVDTDDNQTGQMLAGLLNWPQGTFASRLEFENDKVKVVREIDGGTETLLLNLPAIITTDLRLNEPRYISLPNIVQAKHKSIEIMLLSELGIELKSNIKAISMEIPQKKRAGIKVGSVSELIQRLKNDAKVIA